MFFEKKALSVIDKPLNDEHSFQQLLVFFSQKKFLPDFKFLFNPKKISAQFF